jgi:hypothetical protein
MYLFGSRIIYFTSFHYTPPNVEITYYQIRWQDHYIQQSGKDEAAAVVYFKVLFRNSSELR